MKYRIQVDYLIVGQGLAGTALGCVLQQMGKRIVIIDNDHANASSTVAAGLINPITGRNFVKTWLADTAIPFAKSFYQTLETAFDTKFWYDFPVTWILESPKMLNDWTIVSTRDDVRDYVGTLATAPTTFAETLQDANSYAALNFSGKVDLPCFLQTIRTHWQRHDIPVWNEEFDINALDLRDGARYRNIDARRIIFCEGHQAAHNPLWSDLAFNPAKGEILLVEIPNYPLGDRIIKHKGLFIIPFRPDLYWVGSSYIRQFDHARPTPQERANLEQQLQTILQLPYRVVEHFAGVRPTVWDRKPYLGQHKTHSNVFIFNGLGAKGSYLAPHFAHVLADHLENQTPLPAEVDIARLYKRSRF